MPLYEYLCSSCNWGFELLSGFNQANGTKCPQCGTASTRIQSTFSAVVSNGEQPATTIGGGCGCKSTGTCACSGTH